VVKLTLNSNDFLKLKPVNSQEYENAALKLVEYVQSETFTRILCVALSVLSNGMACLAPDAHPAGDDAIIKRAEFFRKYVFNGSAD
jgi:hypothetical protein